MARSGDGSSAYVTTDPNTVAGPAAYTFHCIYQNAAVPGTAANRGVMSMNDNPTNTYNAVFVWHHTTDPKTLFHRQSSGVFKQVTFASALSANTWYNIGGRYDGSSLTLWLNGVLDATTGTVSAQTAALTPRITLLAEGAGTFNFDNGTIAEAAWWSTNLTDTEMLALGKGVCPLLVRPQSLLLYVPLIRDVAARLGPAVAEANTAVAAHSRVIYPWSGDAWDRQQVFTHNRTLALTLGESESDNPAPFVSQAGSAGLTLGATGKLATNFQRASLGLSLGLAAKVVTDALASGRFRDKEG